MKTIRGKLILLISSILLVACLTIGGVSCVLSYKATSDTLNKTMIETSEIAASQITESLSLYMEQTENIGCIARLANSATTSSDMKTILDERIKMYNMKTIQISDMSGNTKDGESIASQQIFSAALKGETAISNLTVEQDGSTTISVAAPLWKGGLFETEVVGAVYSTFDGDILVDIVSGISVGETGSAYIVDKEGTTIA
ncbi:MAG: cache domain-containing protein, partial [Oscillospiraceae bacterium]